MRNTGTRGYYGYRGRKSGGQKWIVILLAVILAAALIFLVAQRFIVYDNDGSYHFEVPGLSLGKHGGGAAQSGASSGDGTPVTTPEGQDLEIVIEQPEQPEQPEPEPELPLHAQELDVSLLEKGGMTEALAALPGDVNAAAVRLKLSSGDLLYPSALPDAAAAKAVKGTASAAAEIAVLTGSDRHTIARLCALHDSRYSTFNTPGAAVQQIKYKGYVWYDPDSTFYLAPEKEDARKYLASVAKEVAELGFDELLLDEFTYPPVGRLSNIYTKDRTMTQEEALALLADEMRAALPEGVLLSLTLDADTLLAGSNEKTGQSVSVLAPRFDRIYVPTTEDRIAELQAVLEPYGIEMIPILEAAPAAGGVYLLSAG